MSSLESPSTQYLESYVPPVVLGADNVVPLGKVKEAGAVTKAVWIPAADYVGADTNTRTISIINRLQDGSGVGVVATLTLNAASGTSEEETEIAMTLAAVNVAAGDELVFSSVHIGTGLADPGGHVRVEVARSSQG